MSGRGAGGGAGRPASGDAAGRPGPGDAAGRPGPGRVARRRISRVAMAIVVVGSLVWAGAAASAGGGQAVRTVEVTARWSRYSPAVISAKRGTTLRLVVTNADPIDHEFIVGDQAVQDLHEHGTQAHHHAPGEISVPAHSVVVTWWRVTGSTMFGCHMPGHWAYGMRGAIVAT